MALYHFNEAEHIEGPAVIGDTGAVRMLCWNPLKQPGSADFKETEVYQARRA